MSQTHKETSHSLLYRARNLGDEAAWQQLSSHYERFIRYVLKELDVSPSDLDDVTQQTLIVLMRDLSSYDRDRSRFRTWLRRVIRSTALMHFRKRDSQKTKIARYENELACADAEHSPEIDKFIEAEWELYVTGIAMERLRKTFTRKMVKVLELDLRGVPTVEISEQTGLEVSSVYTLRKRVKQRLLTEVRTVIRELEG
ncbi:RNA polymerase sigma factor [Luteolibacter sp. AS25]|uniref:RNA polymerase sigma factor n=1 Tax=Luteolibacter sp. AS25 TaxID=3135776 RepID=UPI00398AE7F3